MKLVLRSGNKVETEITFRKLAKLKEINPKAYEEYNRVIMDGSKDIFDFIAVIYAGYCCNAGNEAMGYQEFLEELVPDIKELIDVYNSLVAREKK